MRRNKPPVEKAGARSAAGQTRETKLDLTRDEILRAWGEAVEHLTEAMDVIEADRLTILRLQAEIRALSERLRILGEGRRSLIRPMCRPDKV
jgi:hypothetical protein